ncbi:PH domain-containing protein [Saccharolobus solfataricus]|uniref:PH domain-containing protein n=2 Tax=Saccharolobus solfataricus TaxID=2287 RepID=A0A0E3M9J7_SACSO|nr:PH domain-containing protein [Saccharolobus solfataricus]AKA72832.1 PH domain-containing protein [Saccharolobus solfataricus]AKA75531.1 PH domain-containing protein [Saccharolobus solfataricus]AKA78224.1 PH domain-containing protein [Saccharolobus solfataricus]AZF67342.1 PH domain-containing protein [Saccharolobus solfataricus]AZF69962.1 PH domain-containing protein [Saccharolobus solfataricus]
MGEKSLVGCTKPTGRRLLVEGTIILTIFSLFLEITSVINYLIFVGIWYAILLFIIAWFKSYTYCISESGIIIKSLLGKKVVKAENFKDTFISQGPIAKKLKCGSIYIILKNGKITVLYDIKNPETFLEKIQSSRP